MRYKDISLFFGDLSRFFEGYIFELSPDSAPIEDLHPDVRAFCIHHDASEGSYTLITQPTVPTTQLFAFQGDNRAGILSQPKTEHVARSINHEELGRPALELRLEGLVVDYPGSIEIGVGRAEVSGTRIGVGHITVCFPDTRDQAVSQLIEHVVGLVRSPRPGRRWPKRVVWQRDRGGPGGRVDIFDEQREPNLQEVRFAWAMQWFDIQGYRFACVSASMMDNKTYKRGEGVLIYQGDEHERILPRDMRESIRRAISFAQFSPICLTSTATFNSNGEPITLTLRGRAHWRYHCTKPNARMRYDILTREYPDAMAEYIEAWLQRESERGLINIMNSWQLACISRILEQRVSHLWSALDNASPKQRNLQPMLFDEASRASMKTALDATLEMIAGALPDIWFNDMATLKSRVANLFQPRKQKITDDMRITQHLGSFFSRVSDLEHARQIRNAISHGDVLPTTTLEANQAAAVLEGEISRLVLALLELEQVRYFNLDEFTELADPPRVPPHLNP